MQKSKSLNEYSQFIGKIKDNLADGLTLEESIKQTIEYCIEHNIMKEFLEANGSEVANMLLSGWNMDEALAVSKEEGFEDGAIYERENNIRKFSTKLSSEEIAEILQLPLEYVLDVLKTE